MILLRYLPPLASLLITMVTAANLSPKLSPSEFLQTTSPHVVLSAEFPTVELHSLFEEWKQKFERIYESLEEGALRKLVWLENHGAYYSLCFCVCFCTARLFGSFPL
jgi:hypothetical protein